ncbi:MAG: shikimate dehydrogenase [Candidatus Marinimicrobia bacterium]|nr:shikimate dehydrogenase [Candidatus Neomarinimicrobiota bacterium]
MSIHPHRKFAVIGNPVDHSLSPQLHKNVFDQLGIDAEYTKMKCPESDLSAMMERLRSGEWDGLNITIPHKQKIIPLLDKLNPRAHSIGSVNCVTNDNGALIGYNTDWFGFSMSLKLNQISVQGHSCVVIGAGGAAYAIVYALLREGANSIAVANRSHANSEKLVEKLSVIQNDCLLHSIPFEQLNVAMNSASIIVNTTPVGMGSNPDEIPAPKTAITSSQILIDIIYSPMKTEFLKFGERIGAKIINGLDMFIYQGLASLDIWMKDRISPRVDINDLKKILETHL